MTLTCDQRPPRSEASESAPTRSESSAVPFDLDPSRRPSPTAATGRPGHRTRSVFRGTVVEVCSDGWTGSPVLIVAVDDGTGPLRFAFLGRLRIGGFHLGAAVTLAGPVGCRLGAPLVLNPQFWLGEDS